MKDWWWKILGILLVFYAIIGGLLVPIPKVGNLFATARNLFYHVPMWFGMIAMLFISAYYSIRFLRFYNLEDDIKASAYIYTAIIMGIIGAVTGAFWANVTWGTYWPRDPKMNGVAAGILLYLAYAVLRASVPDYWQKGKLSASYSLFALPIFIALVVIMPKLTEHSLHPGSGDTVAFTKYDNSANMDSNMRMIFYPAIIGWFLVFLWITDLKIRVSALKNRKIIKETYQE